MNQCNYKKSNKLMHKRFNSSSTAPSYSVYELFNPLLQHFFLIQIYKVLAMRYRGSSHSYHSRGCLLSNRKFRAKTCNQIVGKAVCLSFWQDIELSSSYMHFTIIIITGFVSLISTTSWRVKK